MEHTEGRVLQISTFLYRWEELKNPKRIFYVRIVDGRGEIYFSQEIISPYHRLDIISDVLNFQDSLRLKMEKEKGNQIVTPLSRCRDVDSYI